MIPEVDTVLRSLLAPTGAEVRFELPGAERTPAPLVVLLLHAVQRDTGAQEETWSDLRDDAGRVVGRRAPVRRFRLDYLATAWAADTEREHALLAELLELLAPVAAVPAEHLTELLGSAGEVVTLRVAHPDVPVPDRALLGVGTRPVLTVQVSVALAGRTVEVPVSPETIELGVAGGRPAPARAEPAAPAARVSEATGRTWP